MCKQLLEMGCEEITLADTDGNASTDDVKRVLEHISHTIGLEKIGIHLHDRDGMAILKAKTAFDMGVRIFDAATGGIGGNRAITNAVGNIATGELLNLFDDLGIDTGINRVALGEAADILVGMTKFIQGSLPPSKFVLDRLVKSGDTDRTLKEEPKNQFLEECLARLENFKKLKKDWNNNGADRINPILIDRVKLLIENNPEILRNKPGIYPTARDSIQLEYTRTDGSYLEVEFYLDKFGLLIDGPQDKQEEFEETNYREVISVVFRFLWNVHSSITIIFIEQFQTLKVIG